MHTVFPPPPEDREQRAGIRPPHYAGAAAIGTRNPTETRAPWRRPGRLALLVVCVCALVHAATAADDSARRVELPVHVAELKDLLLAAAQSGNIDDLRAAIEHSPTKPDFGLGLGADEDPIAALKRASEDGEGLETLAALGEILRLPPAALPLGKDIENNLIFVWPYLAERPLDQLTKTEKVELLALVTNAKSSEMREKKRWTWWRLAIGADGAWLSFKKTD
jgi:hypothetical protein